MQSICRLSCKTIQRRSFISRSLCDTKAAGLESSIKLCVLGGGNMAEAIISALSQSKTQNMSDVIVVDINDTRIKHLQDKFGVQGRSNANDAMADAEVILVSVKPQNVLAIADTIVNKPKGLILSIVAGCTIETLESSFKTDRIVRSMPNTPAMVNEGITVWIATKNTPADLVSKARYLLASIGEEIEVKDENLIDMATAVSGSGPAYVFLTMDAMVDAAVHIGFPRDIAVRLVTTTIKGSAIYAQQSQNNIGTLKNQVTSPGGTTASALYELEKGGFRTVVADAVWSAYRRSLELGGNNSNIGPGRHK